MPDYCMCHGTGCDQRDQCFRFRAIPCPYRQSFFMDVPGSGMECDHFMPIEGWPENMLRHEGHELPPMHLPDNQEQYEAAVWRGSLRCLVIGYRGIAGTLGALWWLFEVVCLWPLALIGLKEHAGEFPWWLYSGDDRCKPEK